jgi:hypothetical protein
MVNPLGASDTLTPDLGMTTGQPNRWALNQWWKLCMLVTSSRVSPSLAGRATRSARGLLSRRIAALKRPGASVSHLGALREVVADAAAAPGA